jgi:hypothetical protein
VEIITEEVGLLCGGVSERIVGAEDKVVGAMAAVKVE